MKRSWKAYGAGAAIVMAAGLVACSSTTEKKDAPATPVQAETPAARPDDFDAAALMSQAKILPFPQGAKREGFLVERVEPKSPWAKVGLKPGDVVVAVGDKAIGDTGTSFDLLRAVAHPGSERIEIVRRDPKHHTQERFPLPATVPK